MASIASSLTYDSLTLRMDVIKRELVADPLFRNVCIIGLGNIIHILSMEHGQQKPIHFPNPATSLPRDGFIFSLYQVSVGWCIF